MPQGLPPIGAEVPETLRAPLPPIGGEVGGPAPAATAQPAEPLTAIDQALGVLSGFWKNVNPVTGVKGAIHASNHPIETVQNIGTAQGQLALDAKAAFDSGDYITGVRKSINYLLPVIGPWLDQASNKAAEGKVGEAVGETLGIGAVTMGPGAVKAAREFAPVAKGMTPPAPPTPATPGAVSRVADVISPKSSTQMGRRLGNQALEVAPQLVKDLAEDGAPLTRTEFHGNVRARLASAREGLDLAADERLAARSVSTKPLIDALKAKLARLTMKADEGSQATRTATTRTSVLVDEFGKPITSTELKSAPIGKDVVPGPNAARASVIRQAISELEKIGPSTTYDPVKLMRQAYDGQAEVVYNPSMTADFLKQKGSALGAADVTGVLRERLAVLDPQTAKANAVFSLYKTADDVMSAAAEIERARPKVGRQIMARLTGALVGSSAGPAGVAAGYVGGPILDSALASGVTTQLKTAALLQRLAEATKAGNVGLVKVLTSRLERVVTAKPVLANRANALGPAAATAPVVAGEESRARP